MERSKDVDQTEIEKWEWNKECLKEINEDLNVVDKV
jgi:hypothetical protein